MGRTSIGCLPYEAPTPAARGGHPSREEGPKRRVSTPQEVKAHLRYGFAHRNRARWPIKVICKVLGVSESGYYRYRKNLGKPNRDEVLSAAMRQILDEHPCNDNYGAPRMQLALRQRGIDAGIRRITRIMRKNG